LFRTSSILGNVCLMAVQDSLQKTAFLSHLYITAIILPRQARDKHRESTQKKMPFFAPLVVAPYDKIMDIGAVVCRDEEPAGRGLNAVAGAWQAARGGAPVLRHVFRRGPGLTCR
jgi:hypothetical protein